MDEGLWTERRLKLWVKPVKLSKMRDADAGTVYNFDTIDVDGNPEVAFMCLKRMVGERGFEPPTPWSRTRCSTRLSHSPTVSKNQ
jgi:hypothetical protein